MSYYFYIDAVEFQNVMARILLIYSFFSAATEWWWPYSNDLCSAIKNDILLHGEKHNTWIRWVFLVGSHEYTGLILGLHPAN